MKSLRRCRTKGCRGRCRRRCGRCRRCLRSFAATATSPSRSCARQITAPSAWSHRVWRDRDFRRLGAFPEHCKVPATTVCGARLMLSTSRLTPAVMTAIVLVLLLASSASAATTRRKAMWGPVEMNGVSQFPTYAELGVGIYQSRLGWDTIAPQRPANSRDPADPAYRWPAEIDRAVRRGRATASACRSW